VEKPPNRRAASPHLRAHVPSAHLILFQIHIQIPHPAVVVLQRKHLSMLCPSAHLRRQASQRGLGGTGRADAEPGLGKVGWPYGEAGKQAKERNERWRAGLAGEALTLGPRCWKSSGVAGLGEKRRVCMSRAPLLALAGMDADYLWKLDVRIDEGIGLRDASG